MGFFLPIGAEDDSYFEPLSQEYLVHFTKLMTQYKGARKEDNA